jgi:hypothetical protein
MSRCSNRTGALAVVLAVLLCAPGAFAQRRAANQLEQIPVAKPQPHDVLHLRNEDKITGTILRLDEDAFILEANLVDGEVRVPVSNVALALFRTRDEVPQIPTDRLVFPNGDRLSVRLNRLGDGVLKATTSAGGQIEVKTERLTGLIFQREPVVVYENDFESDDLKRIEPISGTWAIEDGVLKQKERNASFSNAALQLIQDGRFKYEWVANLVSSYSYGFYVFADNASAVHGGTSYLIMAQGQSIYLYKVRNGNQQYLANYRLPKRIKDTRFVLDYDPTNGHIILTVNGDDVFRYRDPEPITSGQYVILRTDSVGNFDEITIHRLGGGRLLPTEAKARGRDIVCLANTDEVSGTVISVDDATVLMKTDYDRDPVDIQREYVSSLTFYRQAATSAKPNSFVVTLVNDDRLTGQLARLDAETMTLDTAVVGQITLDRALVRELKAAEDAGEAVGKLDAEPGGLQQVRQPGVVMMKGRGPVRVFVDAKPIDVEMIEEPAN